MASIKLGLKDLPVPVLIGKSRHIISQITKNTTPPPLLEQVIAATDALDEANLVACGRGSQAFVIKREKTAVLIHLLRTLGAWVQCHSGGSPVFITQCGFEVRRGNTRLGLLPPPTGAAITFTTRQGTLLVRWKPVHGRPVYFVELNAGDVMDESQWKPAAQVTKTKVQLKGLESQKKYWVRIRTVSTAGISAPGQPVPGLTW